MDMSSRGYGCVYVDDAFVCPVGKCTQVHVLPDGGAAGRILTLGS